MTAFSLTQKTHWNPEDIPLQQDIVSRWFTMALLDDLEVIPHSRRVAVRHLDSGQPDLVLSAIFSKVVLSTGYESCGLNPIVDSRWQSAFF